MTTEEGGKLPGNPFVYVNVNVMDDGRAGNIDIELEQDAMLTRNGLVTASITTWSMGTLVANPTAAGMRNAIRDLVDKFLNAWLSANPKK